MKLLDFDSIKGSSPRGSLIFDGTFLYGMTLTGGSHNLGVIFKIKPDGSGYSKLIDFTGPNGSNPFGSIVLEGTYLWGMTKLGGANNRGLIFKIKSDGTGYSQIINFTSLTTGILSEGTLISDGTFLYGMTTGSVTGDTSGGGGMSGGEIFKIKLDGTNYSCLHHFGNVITDGVSPCGALTYDGTFLYGMTPTGGINDTTFGGVGTIFKIQTDGTGYTKLHDFSNSNLDGSYPNGSLISYEGILFGMTNTGGWSSCGFGTLFEINTDGTGFEVLLNFSGLNAGSGGDGKNPAGSLISDGTSLFGMTSGGGTNNLGTIFKFHPTGMSVAEFDKENTINVYPNPSKGNFQISSAKKQILSSDIYNLLGEKIVQFEINNSTSEIDLSDKPNGIYFIKIKTEEGVVSKKIIVNR